MERVAMCTNIQVHQVGQVSAERIRFYPSCGQGEAFWSRRIHVESGQGIITMTLFSSEPEQLRLPGEPEPVAEDCPTVA